MRNDLFSRQGKFHLEFSRFTSGRLQARRIRKNSFTLHHRNQSFSTEKNGYTVPSIPDKEFTGYQILAWYYVSWAMSAPLQLAELGLPYEKEFELAKKMGE